MRKPKNNNDCLREQRSYSLNLSSLRWMCEFQKCPHANKLHISNPLTEFLLLFLSASQGFENTFNVRQYWKGYWISLTTLGLFCKNGDSEGEQVSETFGVFLYVGVSVYVWYVCVYACKLCRYTQTWDWLKLKVQLCACYSSL